MADAINNNPLHYAQERHLKLYAYQQFVSAYLSVRGPLRFMQWTGNSPSTTECMALLLRFARPLKVNATSSLAALKCLITMNAFPLFAY